MFVEKLWKEKPELVIKAINHIGRIDDELAKKLSFKGLDQSGNLKFAATCPSGQCSINVNDFYIRGTQYTDKGFSQSERLICGDYQWMKFMYNQIGDEYIYQYISHRNNKLDSFIAKYETEFNNKTMEVIEQLGFEMNKVQTK